MIRAGSALLGLALLLIIGLGASTGFALTGPPAKTLRVRLLERSRPIEAVLEVTHGVLRCDGRPIEEKRVSLRVEKEAVAVGERRCARLHSEEGSFTLSLGGRSRRYRGLLRVSISEARLAFVNEVGVEDYLRGVVGSETLPGAPEALAAQAVTSRTFALASRSRHPSPGYALCDLTHCQLYRGREDERADSDAAVAKTTGEVLVWGQGGLRPAYFHAACGGATSSAAEVFKEEGSGALASDAVGAAAPLCSASPHFRWTWRVGRSELAAALGFPDAGSAFEPLRRDRAGRVLEVLAFGHRLSGRELLSRVGRVFGYHQLRSMKVSAQEAGSKVLFTGLGLGHGVGMCQAGARAAAERGWDYRRILAHYFPGSAPRRQP